MIRIQQTGRLAQDKSSFKASDLNNGLNTFAADADKMMASFVGLAAFAVAGGSKAIDRVYLSQAVLDFGNVYKLKWEIAPGVYQYLPLNDTVEIPFAAVEARVVAFISAEGIPESQVAIKFYHRLNILANKWFLAMELCKMTQQAPGSAVYDIVPFPAYRYDIMGYPTAIRSNLAGNFDTDYFQNVFCLDNAGIDYELIRSADHVNAVIFPWEAEIKGLCEQNGLYGNPNAILTFCSCCFYVPATDIGTIANVPWPHGIVMHMKNGTYCCLGVNDYVIGPFHNSGADIGGLCPPNCSTYTE